MNNYNHKYSLFFLFFLCLAACAATDKIIPVSSSGSGITKQIALRDAMKNAIIKAVGAYVNTQTITENGDLMEKIIMNSDAIIAQYQEIQSEEKNGIWHVRIIAEVLPNKFLKYCPKSSPQKITSTDIGNLVNKQESLQNAEKTIAMILEDYYLYIYQFKKNNIRISSSGDSNEEVVPIRISFSAQINQKVYFKIKKQLCDLLDKVCLQKEEIIIRRDKDGDINIADGRRTKAKFANGKFDALPLNIGKFLWQKAGLSATEADYDDFSFVAFETHYKKYLVYSLYLVPMKIRQAIARHLYFYSSLVFSFEIAEEISSYNYLYFFSIADLNFFDSKILLHEPYCGFSMDNDEGQFMREVLQPLTLRNFMHLEMSYYYDNRININRKYWNIQGDIKINIPTQKLENMKTLSIYPIKTTQKDEDKEKLVSIANETEKKLIRK